jgi:hypothetical protein
MYYLGSYGQRVTSLLIVEMLSKLTMTSELKTDGQQRSSQTKCNQSTNDGLSERFF